MRTLTPAAPILTAARMRAAEEALFAAGVRQIDLMERAGAAVAREVLRWPADRPVLVLAGPGNNGGDAFVVARLLAGQGRDVQVATLGEAHGEAATAMRRRWAGSTISLDAAEPRAVLVDGLFGTGMSRPLDDAVACRLATLSEHAEATVAIDLPSGLDTDTGRTLGAAPATLTVALGALKPAHVLADGLSCCGHVVLADIGIAAAANWRTIARPRIAAPPPGSHKYTRGMVVVVAGAMPGAARLAARAALHGGAGYVVLAAAERPVGLPDAVVHQRIDGADALRALLDDDRVGSVVIGPGLGRDDQAVAMVRASLESSRALVLDGDALALVAPEQLVGRAAPCWLTPHGGEFGHLFGRADAGKIDATLAAAAASGATVVHKGADTVVASPDGSAIVAADQSSWLSTAGSGDVLAGLCGARMAAGGGADQAVWLHGRAARALGPAFSADDLIAALPRAIAAAR